MHSNTLIRVSLVFAAFASVQGQSIWELGTAPLEFPCTKIGFPLFPVIEDPWIFNTHCMTFDGTAGCFDGECKCNQGADSYFSLPLQKCVGRVGAVCSAEHSNLFPDKLCTPNADCVPDQGEGYSVGKCQCLYGFKPDVEGMCIEDLEIDPEKRSTPRTTTTTETPEQEGIEIPWDLLFNVNYVNYQEECRPQMKLNRTLCRDYSHTVSCQQREYNQHSCQCNMGDEDAIFDQELNTCVGRVGSYCLARKYILGYKACTTGADCVLEDGTSWEDGYSFGTCECLYGYKQTENRTCERDETIPDPSTPRTTTFTPTTIVPPTTTEPPSNTTCPPVGFDKVEHPTKCGLYFVCLNGVAYEEECFEGLHFNPVIKECDFPENVNCTKELPQCPAEGVSFLPHPSGNCSLYLICVEGTPFEQECAPDTCFDPEESKCVWTASSVSPNYKYANEDNDPNTSI